MQGDFARANGTVLPGDSVSHAPVNEIRLDATSQLYNVHVTLQAAPYAMRQKSVKLSYTANVNMKKGGQRAKQFILSF
jgi:hypothetical protein